MQDLGIDPDETEFEPMPPPVATEEPGVMQPVELDQTTETEPQSSSKSALSDIKNYATKRLGVLPDEIELSISLMPGRRAA